MRRYLVSHAGRCVLAAILVIGTLFYPMVGGLFGQRVDPVSTDETSLDEHWREGEQRHQVRTSISLTLVPVDALADPDVQLEIRVENVGEGRALYNPFFQSFAGRPGRLCVFDASKQYRGALLDGRHEAGSYSPPSPAYGLWPFVPANSYTGIRMHLERHRENLVALRRFASETEGPLNFQLHTDERLIEPAPSQANARARMRFDDPAHWGPLVRSNIVSLDIGNALKPAAGQPAVKRVLVSTSRFGLASLIIPSATVVAGENITAEIVFENAGYSSHFYNPFFRPGIAAPAELSLFDHQRRYVGPLEMASAVEQREPTPEDWILVPRSGFIGVRRAFRTTVRGDDGALPSGTYYLRLDFDESLLAKPGQELESPLKRAPRRPLFHSEFVRFEIVEK